MSANAERLGTAAFLRRVFTPDFGKIRPWSGLRRAAVVGLVIWATTAVVDLSAAASTGVAALLVGFLDRRQSPPAVARTMGAGTLALTATTYVTHLIVPWPALVLLLLGLIAFSEGASVAVHKDAPIILHFCGVVCATALLEPRTIGEAAPAAVGVLLAGTAQLVTTVASAYGSPIVREYQSVSAALTKVAEALTAVAGDPADPDAARLARDAVARTGRSMSEAQRTVASSDLALDERLLLEEVICSAERLRIDAKALATPDGGGIAGELLPRGSPVRVPMLRAAALMSEAATALLSRPAARRDTADRLEAMTADAVEHPPDPTGSQGVIAADVNAEANRFVGHVADLLRGGHGRRRSQVSARQRLTSFRSAVRPKSLSFRIGLRIVIASGLAIAVGAWFGLVHASWAVNATLSIFRPDGGGTLPRLILRAAGNIVGALIVVAVAVASDGSVTVLAVAALLFVGMVYVYGPANYGLFAFFLSVSVLSILALTGVDPRAMALARLADTLIGCAVALVVAFAFPIWGAAQLPDKIAAFCSAIGVWFHRLAESARTDPPARDPEGDRRAGIEVRDAVSDVLTTLRVSQLEPTGRVPVGHLVGVFEHARQVARHGIVAENLLSHRAGASPIGAGLAASSAEMMAQASEALHGGVPDPVPPRPGEQPGSGDLVGAEFEAAWRSAELTRRRALG